MATRGQRHGFLVVHRHAGEGLAHLGCRLHRVRCAVDAFRVDVDQAHLHGGKRVLHRLGIVNVLVALVGRRQPFLLRAPVDVLFRMPDVLATEGKAEGLEAHGLIGDVARQNDQVGPRDLVAVLLLDRPQQATRLVEADIVRPGIERREALVAGAAAATSVGDAVGAGRVPGHADHQPAVMSPIGRPPFLAVGHQVGEILLQRRDVELLQLLAIVEVLAHRVRLRVVLVQDVEVQRIRPPLHHAGAGSRVATVHDRALAGGIVQFLKLSVHCPRPLLTRVVGLTAVPHLAPAFAISGLRRAGRERLPSRKTPAHRAQPSKLALPPTSLQKKFNKNKNIELDLRHIRGQIPDDEGDAESRLSRRSHIRVWASDLINSNSFAWGSR